MAVVVVVVGFVVVQYEIVVAMESAVVVWRCGASRRHRLGRLAPPEALIVMMDALAGLCAAEIDGAVGLRCTAAS